MVQRVLVAKTKMSSNHLLVVELTSQLEAARHAHQQAKETLGRKFVEHFFDNKDLHKLAGDYALANQTFEIRNHLLYEIQDCNGEAAKMRELEQKLITPNNREVVENMIAEHKREHPGQDDYSYLVADLAEPPAEKKYKR